MAQVTQKSLISPELYQATLEQLQLQAVSLDEVRACCDKEVAQDGQVEIELTAENASRQSETEFFAFITYHLRGIREKASLLEIDAKYRLIFNATAPVPEGFFEVFQDLNLRLTTMPYFRELVASITGRMEIPTFTLPYHIYAASQEEIEEPAAATSPDKLTKKRSRKPQTTKS